MKIAWENIYKHGINDCTLATNRLKVYGGWIVRTIYFEREPDIFSESSVFVPDPQHEWSIA